MADAPFQIGMTQRRPDEAARFADRRHESQDIGRPGESRPVSVIDPALPIRLAVESVGVGEAVFLRTQGGPKFVEPGGGLTHPAVDRDRIGIVRLLDPAVRPHEMVADPGGEADLGMHGFHRRHDRQPGTEGTAFEVGGHPQLFKLELGARGGQCLDADVLPVSGGQSPGPGCSGMKGHHIERPQQPEGRPNRGQRDR